MNTHNQFLLALVECFKHTFPEFKCLHTENKKWKDLVDYAKNIIKANKELSITVNKNKKYWRKEDDDELLDILERDQRFYVDVENVKISWTNNEYITKSLIIDDIISEYNQTISELVKD